MYRIIYKSRSSTSLDWDLIRNILRKSEERNAKDNITGVLLATQKHFLQVLEGDRQSVNDTFIRIARDDRHDAVELIGFGPIESRMYPGWSMRGIGVFDLNKDIELQLVSKYGEEDETVRIPLVEWEALSLINDVQHSHVTQPENARTTTKFS